MENVFERNGTMYQDACLFHMTCLVG